jgi:hypothetical protein
MSPTMKKRIRVYALAAGIVVAIMAGIPPLDTVQWPKAVIAILGLVVGILNIRGKGEMDRFLIAAIGLKITVDAFLGFSEVQETQTAVAISIVNLEVFITAALLYVSLASLYDVLKDNLNTYKKWFYFAAIFLVIVGLIFSILEGNINQSWVSFASLGLLILGLIVGYLEGPKNPDEAEKKVGGAFLIAAVGFWLSSSSVGRIVETDFAQYEVLLKNLKNLLENSAIFTTSALLLIAFMSIFWVLDAITDNP